MGFQKAVRKKVWLKGALTGATHSGKTLGALLLARGIAGEGGRIAVLDTEHGRASHYADAAEKGVDFDFDAMDLDPPFKVERYTGAIDEAEKAGYQVLVIDSLSHAWMGEGGVLDFVDQQGGNSFSNGWRKATPKQRALVDKILRSRIHIICTMRSQMAYEVVENDKGKKEPRKIGLKPMQRSDFEYEFAFVLDIQREGNMALVTKDVTGVLPADGFKIATSHGQRLGQWIEGGEGEMPADPADVLRDELPDCTTGDDLKAWWMRAGSMDAAYGLKEAFSSHVKKLGYQPKAAATKGELVPLDGDKAAA